MPNSLPPSSPLPWYAEWWVPAVLVTACAAYLLVLAGGYVTASVEPSLPVAVERPAVAPEPAAPPAPARVVAAAAAIERRPTPKPRPKPVVVAAPSVAVPVTPVPSHAMSTAVARSRSALARVSEAISWSPFGSTPAPATSTVWTLPVAHYRLTARFGDVGQHWQHAHTGLDLAAPVGTSVGVVDAGVVTSAGWNGSYGQQVVVRHADGTLTSYSHLSSIGVATGTVLARGQLVGRVGATGNVTGPHLHLEVRPGGGDPVDPVEALRQHGVVV